MARILLTTDHVHRPGRRKFAPPAAYEEKNQGAVVGLVAQLYDAALDDCPECCQELLALAQDAATAGVLIGWGCEITSETYGGLPEILLEGSEPDDAPFHPTAAFRTIAYAYENAGVTGVYTACAQCTAEERLEAAKTALELVVGLSDFGDDFLYQ